MFQSLRFSTVAFGLILLCFNLTFVKQIIQRSSERDFIEIRALLLLDQFNSFGLGKQSGLRFQCESKNAQRLVETRTAKEFQSRIFSRQPRS